MPVSIETLGIDRLSVRDRLELIEQLWDSLPEQVSPDEVPAWHLAELAKRRAAADADPGASIPLAELRRELRGGAGVSGPSQATPSL